MGTSFKSGAIRVATIAMVVATAACGTGMSGAQAPGTPAPIVDVTAAPAAAEPTPMMSEPLTSVASPSESATHHHGVDSTPAPTSSPGPTTEPTPASPEPASPAASLSPEPSESMAPGHHGGGHDHPSGTTLDLPRGIDPVRIEIPAIDVEADVVDLSLGNGDPEVPDEAENAGWYTSTRNPGEIGPAVIAGHIDSSDGPAVFYNIDELEPGDEIIVHGAEGDHRTFTVQDTGQYSKYDLPDKVFGFGGPRPELRLITCGGSFDSDVGHYRDNIVVYAAMVT